jgi:hypothetical protein
MSKQTNTELTPYRIATIIIVAASYFFVLIAVAHYAYHFKTLNAPSAIYIVFDSSSKGAIHWNESIVGSPRTLLSSSAFRLSSSSPPSNEEEGGEEEKGINGVDALRRLLLLRPLAVDTEDRSFSFLFFILKKEKKKPNLFLFF